MNDRELNQWLDDHIEDITCPECGAIHDEMSPWSSSWFQCGYCDTHIYTVTGELDPPDYCNDPRCAWWLRCQLDGKWVKTESGWDVHFDGGVLCVEDDEASPMRLLAEAAKEVLS